MKVMHLLQSSKFSGAENVVCQIISLFTDDKEVEMIYVCPDGPIRQELEKRKIKYVMLPTFSQKEINRAVKRIKPDFIHAHDFNASVRASMIRGVKVISHLHSNPSWLQKVCPQSIIYALRAYRFIKIIGVSSIIREEYIFHKAVDKKFQVISNVVDTNRVAALSQANSIDSFDLLYVGRLSEAKNPIAFLTIIKKLCDKGIGVTAKMIGVGPLENLCKSYIINNGLSDCVQMLGFQSNPYQYMLAAKIIVITSTYEGFGLVAVEAMSLNKLVIASRVGALIDILSGNCGITCTSIEDYCKAISFYLADEEKRTAIGRLAGKKSLKYANINEFQKQIKQVYL